MITDQPFHICQWVEVKRNIGNTVEPRISIEVEATDGGWQPFEMKIDTGAAISFLNYDDCAIIGLKLEEGVHRKFKAVGKTEVEGYVHSVNLKIGERTFPNVRVVFWKDKEKNDERLLGVLDIFEKMQIALRAKTRRSYLTLEKTQPNHIQ